MRPFISQFGSEKMLPFICKGRQLGGVKTATEVIKDLLPLYLYWRYCIQQLFMLVNGRVRKDEPVGECLTLCIQAYFLSCDHISRYVSIILSGWEEDTLKGEELSMFLTHTNTNTCFVILKA